MRRQQRQTSCAPRRAGRARDRPTPPARSHRAKIESRSFISKLVHDLQGNGLHSIGACQQRHAIARERARAMVFAKALPRKRRNDFSQCLALPLRQRARGGQHVIVNGNSRSHHAFDLADTGIRRLYIKHHTSRTTHHVSLTRRVVPVLRVCPPAVPGVCPLAATSVPRRAAGSCRCRRRSRSLHPAAAIGQASRPTPAHRAAPPTAARCT